MDFLCRSTSPRLNVVASAGLEIVSIESLSAGGGGVVPPPPPAIFHERLEQERIRQGVLEELHQERMAMARVRQEVRDIVTSGLSNNALEDGLERARQQVRDRIAQGLSGAARRRLAAGLPHPASLAAGNRSQETADQVTIAFVFCPGLHLF